MLQKYSFNISNFQYFGRRFCRFPAVQYPPNIKEVEKRRLWRNSTIQLPGAGRIFDICYVNTPQKSNTLINIFSENGIWCSYLYLKKKYEKIKKTIPYPSLTSIHVLSIGCTRLVQGACNFHASGLG
jgi:hypothetical protein